MTVIYAGAAASFGLDGGEIDAPDLMHLIIEGVDTTQDAVRAINLKRGIPPESPSNLDRLVTTRNQRRSD